METRIAAIVGSPTVSWQDRFVDKRSRTLARKTLGSFGRNGLTRHELQGGLVQALPELAVGQSNCGKVTFAPGALDGCTGTSSTTTGAEVERRPSTCGADCS